MEPIVIKLGGAAISNPHSVKTLAQSVAYLKSQGESVVVVHGGGPMINQMLTERGIKWSFFEGQRITTPEMMSVIVEALTEVNHMICQELLNCGVAVRSMPGNVYPLFYCQSAIPELGMVGKINHVDSQQITSALADGFVPVVTPVGIDNKGQSYNINADWGASSLAASLSARSLIFATDQRGILDFQGLPYDGITLADLRILMKKGVVSGGMLAKCRSIEQALLDGVGRVCVTHALELLNLVETKSGGTVCVSMSRLDYALKMKESSYAVCS